MPVPGHRFPIEHYRRDWPSDVAQPRHADVPKQIETTAAVTGNGAALADVELGALAIELRLGEVTSVLKLGSSVRRSHSMKRMNGTGRLRGYAWYQAARGPCQRGSAG
jgi:hypothetical protein